MSKIYDDRMDVAFAGMKGDNGFGRVETFAAETTIPFGAVVTEGTNSTQVKLGGNSAVGVALHSHTVVGQYERFDAVSVITRGLVWCVVKDEESVTDRGGVQFDPATGKVSDSAGTRLAHATFRSGAVKTNKYGTIALIELHAPQV